MIDEFCHLLEDDTLIKMEEEDQSLCFPAKETKVKLNFNAKIGIFDFFPIFFYFMPFPCLASRSFNND